MGGSEVTAWERGGPPEGLVTELTEEVHSEFTRDADAATAGTQIGEPTDLRYI